MARLNRGPNGPFSGKAGSVIGSSWRGIYYIKGLQKKITKERSPLQIEQQNKFALAVKFLMPVKSIVDMGFSRINPGGATGYNMAISHMVQHCIKGTSPDLEIDYSSVIFCTKGRLSTPEQICMELNDMKLKLTWSIDNDIYSYIDDKVRFLIYQPGLNQYDTNPEGIIRGNGEVEIGLDPDCGDTVHVYMYMVSDRYTKRKWSNSVYVGALKIRE